MLVEGLLPVRHGPGTAPDSPGQSGFCLAVGLQYGGGHISRLVLIERVAAAEQRTDGHGYDVPGDALRVEGHGMSVQSGESPRADRVACRGNYGQRICGLLLP